VKTSNGDNIAVILACVRAHPAVLSRQ